VEEYEEETTGTRKPRRQESHVFLTGGCPFSCWAAYQSGRLPLGLATREPLLGERAVSSLGSGRRGTGWPAATRHGFCSLYNLYTVLDFWTKMPLPCSSERMLTCSH
jgi:hypothetical protein